MGEAGYVVAGYGVTALVLAGYLVSLRLRIRRASTIASTLGSCPR